MKYATSLSIVVGLMCTSIALDVSEGRPETRPNYAPPALATSAGQIVEEYTLFRQLENGVLTVSGDLYEGSGFIADERGILLTSRHLVQNTTHIRVQSGSGIRLEANLLAEDSDYDIAAIWVNLTALKEFVVVPLARPDALGSSVGEGERILAIGSPTHKGEVPMLATGIVISVQPKKILSDAKLSEFHEGGPLINLRGEVVGMVHEDGCVPVNKLEAILGAASKRAATASVPSTRLLPLEPEVRFPVQALTEFVQSPRFQDFSLSVSEGGENWLLTTARNPRLQGSGSDSYQFQVGKYNVLVLSPIVVWYLEEEDTIKSNKEAAKHRKKVHGAHDVAQMPWNWDKYEGKLPSVVRILAIPEFGQTKTSFLMSGITKGVTQLRYKTSFSEMFLLCDGKEIEPIERKKFPVELPDGYGTPEGEFALAGDYTYSPDAFDPDSCRKLEIKIASKDKAEMKAKVIPAQTVQQVWADFEGYREALMGE